ncbi:beta-galactosidase [Novosphingobium sp. SG751A]|uniref:glycoside hydrolase family 2 TIM barrel-domain containing protein n=1 Tax=Novosphingobium sp. SG751A TaxID=2587000 RepID=UPI0015520B7B|nr:glycoside hydrolase family 2 TIM barrel-domain containing protein [Novosphingobium sp. SG751A]NOW48875.1 beta-galactosidase [Novosphingobium sp. SG751A]
MIARLLARTAAFALGAALASHAAAQEARTVLPLASGWRFTGEDTTADAAKPDFADGGWQAVSVPHTWNRVGYYHHDLGGTNTAATVAKKMGVGWYRHRFDAPATLAGRKTWIEFDAASRVAQVWLNGVLLGEHRGGFGRFRLDATAALKPGQSNVLAVRVDNSQPAAGSSTSDVLPLFGDFFVHGGLYRPVRLVSTAPLHVDMQDFGGPGLYANTAAVQGGDAQVHVRLRLTNDAGKPVAAGARIALIDRDGKVAAQTLVKQALGIKATQEVAADLTVAGAHLWQGVADPYLYRLRAEVLGADGKVSDTVEQNFGIRTMRFDADKGFFLNDKPYVLHGVGYHQDRDGKGWAISPADVEEDVATMREMGVNSIRLTHYQHGQMIHDLADRYGFVLWDEVPLVSAWTLAGKLEPEAALVANARQQLSELIHQNYNHAATAIWSIANEVDFGNSLPAFIRGGTDGKTPDPMPLLHELQALAKAQDPSRPTALATCCEGRLFGADVAIPETAAAADLGGANRYFGWYFGKEQDLGPTLDQLHAKRPAQPLSVTEYGAGGALTIHTDNVLGGAPDSRGAAQPEEYESYIHETALAQIAARPYLYASWLWNSFDFATTVRTEGDAQDINTKGLVAYDHKTRKDAWYFYKANWSDAPTIRITGRRYAARAYGVTDVKVYSNAQSTELLLNGRSLGKREGCAQMVCVWPGVMLDAGENRLVARGIRHGAAVEDQITWTLSPEKRGHIAIDAGALVAAKSKTRLLGSDNWFEGGEVASLDKPADYGRKAEPARIEGTTERDAIATYRKGDFAYHIPAPAGRYKLTLWFPAVGGQAKGGFDVRANGKPILRAFEPTAPAADAAAVARSFYVTSKGQIDLEFKAGAAPARISLIELDAQ